ncbi:unnamed protein product [Cylicostephanus goldi]|uniref:Uncharacterized protein n=1 Tax=Cylicostephanus goldi TaxID=71465 RepID=A0A3P6R076_CYLGO|nr:unnamed protein product [Cylicostephanus goldi]
MCLGCSNHLVLNIFLTGFVWLLGIGHAWIVIIASVVSACKENLMNILKEEMGAQENILKEERAQEIILKEETRAQENILEEEIGAQENIPKEETGAQEMYYLPSDNIISLNFDADCRRCPAGGVPDEVSVEMPEQSKPNAKI